MKIREAIYDKSMEIAEEMGYTEPPVYEDDSFLDPGAKTAKGMEEKAARLATRLDGNGVSLIRDFSKFKDFARCGVVRQGYKDIINDLDVIAKDDSRTIFEINEKSDSGYICVHGNKKFKELKLMTKEFALTDSLGHTLYVERRELETQYYNLQKMSKMLPYSERMRDRIKAIKMEILRLARKERELYEFWYVNSDIDKYKHKIIETMGKINEVADRTQFPENYSHILDRIAKTPAERHKATQFDYLVNIPLWEERRLMPGEKPTLSLVCNQLSEYVNEMQEAHCGSVRDILGLSKTVKTKPLEKKSKLSI